MQNIKKGFTLAELLIVVAIIAVLVAVSIPVFTNQLEKAREATDAANIRAAIEKVSEQSFNSDVPQAEAGKEYTVVSEDNGVYTIWVKMTQTMDDWQIYPTGKYNLAGNEISADVSNDHWVVSLDTNEQKYNITVS